LTIGGGTHATRLILILPPLIILTAIGFEVIFNSLSLVFKYLVGLSMVGLLTVNVLGFGHYYQGHYRQLSASLWHYGYQQLFNSLAPYLSDTSRHIYINDTYQPSLLPFLFYTKTPPSRFQKTFHDNIAFTASPLFKGFVYSDQISFGEVQFGRLKDPQRLRDLLEPGDIYVAVQLIEVEGDWDWSKNPPSGLKAIETVRNVFGQPQFYLLEETSL
jgi:hypothetical protein